MVRMLLVIPSALLALAACAPTEQRFCERMDECNALVGVSVDECTSDFADLLTELSDSDEKDCRTTLDRCMENESCDNFVVCVLEDAGVPCGSTYSYYYYTF